MDLSWYENIEPPTLSDIALENSFDGAEAYAYFLFQAWWYLINTHDIDWWDQNIPDAPWSRPLREKAVSQIEKGLINMTPPITPVATDRKVNADNSSEFRITLQANVSDIYAKRKGGDFYVENPAKAHQLIARLLYNGNGWDIVAVTIALPKEEE